MVEKLKGKQNMFDPIGFFFTPCEYPNCQEINTQKYEWIDKESQKPIEQYLCSTHLKEMRDQIIQEFCKKWDQDLLKLVKNEND